MYSAKDSNGNESNISRIISVVDGVSVLEGLVLNQSSINLIKKKKIFRNYYFGERYAIKVMGVYSDGHREELTDHVTWTRESDGKDIEILPYYLQTIGISKLRASIKNIQSEILDVSVQKEDEGRLLAYRVYNNHKNIYPNRDAEIRFRLMYQPTENVTLKFTLEGNDKIRFKNGTLSTELTFQPTDSFTRNIFLIDDDINNSTTYRITTDTFETNDPRYEGKEPSNIEVSSKEIILVPPPIEQRRGAIRGLPIEFRVLSEVKDLKYRLINPPIGMNIIGQSHLEDSDMYDLDGVDIQWNVPMNIEEKIHNITVEARDIEGNIGKITFSIKVPKTKLIETEIINNELIVIDKTSTLYGVKMKGHSGEDISDLKIRTVDYFNVWRKKVKSKKPEDSIQRVIFILDNMPNLLDMKMPKYLDSIEKARSLDAMMYRYNMVSINWDKWKPVKWREYIYEGKSGVTLLEGSKLFMDVLRKAQYKSDW